MDEKNRLGSEQEFWRKYSRNEDKLTYHEILKTLQASRSAAATAAANDARSFFQGKMECELAQGIFTYIKKNTTFPCVKDATIAQKWHALLVENEEVREEWERMQGDIAADADRMDVDVSEEAQI